MLQNHVRTGCVARGLALAVAFVLVLLAGARPVGAVIDNPGQTLSQQCQMVDAIAVLQVEKVNREKKGIVYRKVRDLKGAFPGPRRFFGNTLTHVLRQNPNPDWHHQDIDTQDLQNDAIVAGATEGQTAVVFQRGGEQAICVGHAWYTARGEPPAQERWVQAAGADSRFCRLFCGEVDQLAAAITSILAGKQVTVPRMIGTAQMLSERIGPIRGLRTDKLDPHKDFYSPFHWQAPWGTHRGNQQRTGADDGPGPKTPKVLWAYQSRDHFIAPLVPDRMELFAPSIGAFNTPGLHALALDPAAAKRQRWSKSTPVLDQPGVAAPAVVSILTGVLIFGDGMHQSERASLHCLRARDGFPLWRLPVPHKLVHFEGTPTIAGTPSNRDWRVFIGGGGAGVLCVNPVRVTVEGKDQELSTASALRDQRWQELLAKYQVEVKKDPTFTVRPDESMLPSITPKVLWQQGEDKWHVDAPVAVVENRLLAASSFLEDENIGDRSLICLEADTGAVLWKRPLKLNPWAGPTIGPYALVGCSSARLDPEQVRGAKGEVVALELETGAVKWRKELPGGVLSSIALRQGLAIFTATDGKVRAWDAFTGREEWTYDARQPFFGGVAATDTTVYAADLKGMVHAMNLTDGKAQWKLDLATLTQSAGMVYGAPVVRRGRLYVATGNLEGARGQSANVVACIGEK